MMNQREPVWNRWVVFLRGPSVDGQVCTTNCRGVPTIPKYEQTSAHSPSSVESCKGGFELWKVSVVM